jgi:hypothetical protein
MNIFDDIALEAGVAAMSRVITSSSTISYSAIVAAALTAATESAMSRGMMKKGVALEAEGGWLAANKLPPPEDHPTFPVAIIKLAKEE